MSASHRFIFSTFLILALGCFWASAAFATTYKYYRYGSNQCTLDKSSACSNALNIVKQPYLTNPSVSITQTSCTDDSSSISLSYKYARVNLIDGSLYDIENRNTGAGEVLNHVCSNGEKFELIGCTAQCVADPCNALKDNEEVALVSCGTVTCLDGGTIVGSGSSAYCSNGKKAVGVFVPAPIATIGGCSAALKPLTSPITSVKVKSTASGSSAEAYCSATYKHQGVSTPQIDVPSNLVPITFTGADYPDANGDCSDPTKPIKSTINGQTVCYPNDGGGNGCPVQGEKPNANGVCVSPDDPTYPEDDDPTKPDPKTSCDAGEIRNNSGKCVPYADATKCEAGQVRDNLGLCSADPKANSCPQGTVKNKTTGACSADPRGTGCPNNQLPDKLGMCPDGSASCAVGKIRNASGACVGSDPTKPPEGTGCKDGSSPNSSGVCADGSASCPVGKVRGSDGKCSLDTTESNTTGTASSDCDVAPDCGGDPLQCATLEQIWRSSCEQTKAFAEISKEDAEKMSSAATASQAEYDAHQAAVDAQASGFFSEFESKASSVSSSGQCINDLSVPVMGHSMTIPFSQACDFFRFLRILVLFSAYMLAARIIFGGLT